jgi:hypothetical protein
MACADRLASPTDLEPHREKFPDKAKDLHVPYIIFDGRTEGFATEMFVVLNSTDQVFSQRPLAIR